MTKDVFVNHCVVDIIGIQRKIFDIISEVFQNMHIL